MIVARSRERELPAAASTIRASPDCMSSEPFNSSRARLLQENAAFAASLPPGVRVLDASAGTHRYRHLFGHTHYKSADFNEQYAPTDVCDLTQIPVPNDRYDAVVINQVLEHVPDPLAVLIELRRILRPGGRLIYTAPLFFEEHLQPYDFYRYTQFGVRHLFDRPGFKIDRLDWLEGYFGTLGYQFATMGSALPRHPTHYGGGLRGVIAASVGVGLKMLAPRVSRLFHRLEIRHKYTGHGYPKNYVVLATKPDTA
jgi:SAM-dependent methyltransferase